MRTGLEFIDLKVFVLSEEKSIIIRLSLGGGKVRNENVVV